MSIVMQYVPAAQTPMPPVSQCTRRQGRLALLQAGLLTTVESMIASIPDAQARAQAQIEYEADTWEADNATLQAMWEALGKAPDELAEFFALAAQL